MRHPTLIAAPTIFLLGLAAYLLLHSPSQPINIVQTKRIAHFLEQNKNLVLEPAIKQKKRAPASIETRHSIAQNKSQNMIDSQFHIPEMQALPRKYEDSLNEESYQYARQILADPTKHIESLEFTSEWVSRQADETNIALLEESLRDFDTRLLKNPEIDRLFRHSQAILQQAYNQRNH